MAQESISLFHTHKQNNMWTREEDTSPTDKRTCEHSKLTDMSDCTTFKKKLQPLLFSKAVFANSAVPVAHWFQGTHPISQHYNQAKSLPAGHRYRKVTMTVTGLAAERRKKTAALKFPLQRWGNVCSGKYVPEEAPEMLNLETYWL